jgi:methyltransferase (TIGR00027 family)
MIRIDNARVFDGEQLLDGVCVLIDGPLIAAVAPAGQLRAVAAAADCEVIDGTGCTLLPGLIDSHTHVIGTLDNLRLALAFGVTTELDMFSFPPELTGWLCEAAAETDDVADMRTSGTVACPAGGHPVASLPFIPSLAGPQDAAEFVTARQKEGSHYIKVMFDDGAHLAQDLPTLDAATARAVADQARSAGLLTVAHIADTSTVRAALGAGIDAITHLPLDSPLPRDVVRTAAADGRFFIPTLAMMEVSAGAPEGRELADDDRIAAYLPAEVKTAIRVGTEGRCVMVPPAGLDFRHALRSTALLHEAGVPVLAGTDANNAPGRACPVVHGAALHRELELLVAAGLAPAAALTAATAAPARQFGLADRGRIAPGMRADLLLVHGDPTVDITATRDIAGIWKRGAAFDREEFRLARVVAADQAGSEAGPGDGAKLTSVGSTALAVAAARALESTRDDRLFDDQIAVQVVSAAGAEAVAWSGSRGELIRLAMGDYFAIRTRYFDDYLLGAVAAGVRQVVILGAGFDARAYRLAWPAPVSLYELDRSDVFSIKDKIITGRAPAPGCTRVAVVADLLEDWPDALLARGFDPRQPTAWLLEGLVVYLSEQEADLMLTRIGELSAAGSRIGVEYGSVAMFATANTDAALAHASGDDTLHALSALWRNTRTTDPLAWLAGHGWPAGCDEIADAARECGRPVPPAFDPRLPGTARISLLVGLR